MAYYVYKIYASLCHCVQIIIRPKNQYIKRVLIKKKLIEISYK